EDLRRAGAASLDLGWTACGTFDGFFELGLGTWDVAAGAALVLELGGRVSDWSGGDAWLETGDILAAPAAVHEVLLELAANGSREGEESQTRGSSADLARGLGGARPLACSTGHFGRYPSRPLTRHTGS